MDNIARQHLGFGTTAAAMKPGACRSVLEARLYKRSLGTKSWYFHVLSPSNFSNIAIVVGRQFSDQKWEFLGNINPHEKLLGHIGIAVGVGKNDLHNLSSPA